MCNVKCHAVGIVKGFLPEEVLFVDCFFLYWVKCSKEKEDLNQFLLCWITFGGHKICCSEILIYCLLANTSVWFFFSNWAVFLRGLLLFLVCVVAEMLGIKELAKKNLSCFQKAPVIWQNFLSYLKNLKLGHKNWTLSSGCLQWSGKI